MPAIRPSPWRLFRRPKKRRKHGPGWVAPKVMRATIVRDAVPVALGLGWAPLQIRPARKGERRFAEFDFERIFHNRIEHAGFDYQYGDRPSVWLVVARWRGQNGVCVEFSQITLGDDPPRRSWWGFRLPRRRDPPPPAAERATQAVAEAVRLLHVAEARLQEDTPLGLVSGDPQWPDGYAERMRDFAAAAQAPTTRMNTLRRDNSALDVEQP